MTQHALDWLGQQRVWIGVAGFIVLLLLEQRFAFKPFVSPRFKRYAANFGIFGINALFLSFGLSGILLTSHRQFDLQQWGVLRWLDAPLWMNIIASVVILDGVTYFWHRAYHRIPLMWRMHRVHHTDLDLDVTSSARFHPTEMILSAFFRLGVIALLGAEFAAVLIFEIIFGAFNQFEHANLKLPDAWDRRLRWIFVTPDMHRVHHSRVRAETNSNFATIFSIWDRCFGTYNQVEDQTKLRIGLEEYPNFEDVALVPALRMPFVQAGKLDKSGPPP